MRILTIAAHPDDETLGAGGTMARLAAGSHEVGRHEAGPGPDVKHRLPRGQCGIDVGADGFQVRRVPELVVDSGIYRPE